MFLQAHRHFQKRKANTVSEGEGRNGDQLGRERSFKRPRKKQRASYRKNELSDKVVLIRESGTDVHLVISTCHP